MNEFMKSSFLQKYEPDIVRISALYCTTLQGRNPYNCWLIFWEKWWSHKFTLKFTELYILGIKRKVAFSKFGSSSSFIHSIEFWNVFVICKFFWNLFPITDFPIYPYFCLFHKYLARFCNRIDFKVQTLFCSYIIKPGTYYFLASFNFPALSFKREGAKKASFLEVKLFTRRLVQSG